jgi:D-cysteine desulfhydrase
VPLLDSTYPGLRALRRVALVEGPTPVRPLEIPGVSASLWCKRDDESSERFGGNKLRKLEWLLGEARAQGATHLVTGGADGSNHVLASSLFGRQHGFEVEAVVLEGHIPGHDDDASARCLDAGARLHRVRSYPAVVPRLLNVERRIRREGGRPYRIGPGGTSPISTLGYIEAALELSDQVRDGHCPEPEAIFVATGTGGTAVGLAMGLCLTDLRSEVVAVRVATRLAINRMALGRLAEHTEALLRRRAPASSSCCLPTTPASRAWR